MYVDLRVSDLFNINWTPAPLWGDRLVPKQFNNWQKTNTYFIVFSLGQQQQLKLFKENCGGFNILYEGKPAYNVGHGSDPRNTLIIFEVKEEFFGSDKK